MAGYYGAPLGLTLKSVLPGGMWGESQVIVSLRNGSRDSGGVSGEVLAWLEKRLLRRRPEPSGVHSGM